MNGRILFSIFASILLFACSSDDQSSTENDAPKGLEFEIKAATQLQTKAGSPVYSQDATQSVTRVSVLAFRSDGTNFLYVKTYDISGWSAGTNFKRYPVADVDKLPAGNYKFLAIGRDATDLYQLMPATLTVGTTKIEDVTASITNSGDEYEIFAGSTQADVLAQGTRVSITMTRKIAGILGYFKNVPQMLDGKTVKFLRLTASQGNKQVNLVSGLGSTAATTYNIFNMDLSGQPVQNEMYTGNDLSGVGVVKLANSQLSGAYLIPAGGVTLTLGLYDASNVAIKTWSVKDANSTTFNILANNFYSLGVKQKANSTTGTDPNDPGDDDSAIDLLQDQTITITIDPAWNTIHPLVIQ